jgi:hypothetical protein
MISYNHQGIFSQGADGHLSFISARSVDLEDRLLKHSSRDWSGIELVSALPVAL